MIWSLSLAGGTVAVDDRARIILWYILGFRDTRQSGNRQMERTNAASNRFCFQQQPIWYRSTRKKCQRDILKATIKSGVAFWRVTSFGIDNLTRLLYAQLNDSTIRALSQEVIQFDRSTHISHSMTGYNGVWSCHRRAGPTTVVCRSGFRQLRLQETTRKPCCRKDARCAQCMRDLKKCRIP